MTKTIPSVPKVRSNMMTHKEIINARVRIDAIIKILEDRKERIKDEKFTEDAITIQILDECVEFLQRKRDIVLVNNSGY